MYVAEYLHYDNLKIQKQKVFNFTMLFNTFPQLKISVFAIPFGCIIFEVVELIVVGGSWATSFVNLQCRYGCPLICTTSQYFSRIAFQQLPILRKHMTDAAKRAKAAPLLPRHVHACVNAVLQFIFIFKYSSCKNLGRLQTKIIPPLLCCKGFSLSPVPLPWQREARRI